LIQEAQQKLMRAKEKAFNVMIEQRKIYRARGEHKKAKDVDADMDLCQSRVGKILQEVGAKLRDLGKSAAKAHSHKGSFDTENVQQWWKEEQKRISQREIEGSRSDGQSRHQGRPAIEDRDPVFQAWSTLPRNSMEISSRSHLERVSVPKFNWDKTKFERFWAAFSNCVDKGPESPQMKMLRLEACLVGKAADTLEDLDYSEMVTKPQN